MWHENDERHPLEDEVQKALDALAMAFEEDQISGAEVHQAVREDPTGARDLLDQENASHEKMARALEAAELRAREERLSNIVFMVRYLAPGSTPCLLG